MKIHHIIQIRSQGNHGFPMSDCWFTPGECGRINAQYLPCTDGCCNPFTAMLLVEIRTIQKYEFIGPPNDGTPIPKIYSHTIILLPQETPNTHVIGLQDDYGNQGHIIGSAEKKNTWILAMFYPMHLFHWAPRPREIAHHEQKLPLKFAGMNGR